ncbi:MAG: hypothetical protein WC926_05035 [Candidatus Paceibacterota bacterium]|jgi:hypothetical protein
MNKKAVSIAIIAGIILMAGLFLVFTRQNNSQKETPAPEALLTIETRGGLCPYGPCDAKTEIREDGSYLYTNGKGEETKGSLPANDVKNLEELIENADFTAIRSKKFTGMCPTDYDGQEYIYTFYTAKQVIQTCTYEIDYADPMFKTIDSLLSTVYSNLK